MPSPTLFLKSGILKLPRDPSACLMYRREAVAAEHAIVFQDSHNRDSDT